MCFDHHLSKSALPKESGRTIMQQTTALIVTVLLVVEVVTYPTEFPKKCSKSSPQLNECIKLGLATLLRQLKYGLQELGVPSLDPLEAPYLQTRHDDGNLTLDLTMKNVVITGLTDISLDRVTTNLHDVNKMEIVGRTPALHIRGDYITDGLIVNFPLHSAGPFALDMTEVTSSWIIYLKEASRGGNKYLQVDSFDIDMMPVDISFRPAKQLDGDNKLGEAVSFILNSNSNEVYKKLKPELAGMLSGFLTEVANKILSKVPETTYLEL